MRGEIRKIIKSRMSLIAAVILIANILLCFFTCRDAYGDLGRTDRELAYAFGQYHASKEQYDAWCEEYAALLKAAEMSGEDDEEFYSRQTLFENPGVTDIRFYMLVKNEGSKDKTRLDELKKVVSEAESGLRSCEDEAEREYLTRVKDIYTRQTGLKLSKNHVYGFGELFSFGLSGVLIIVMMAMCGVIAAHNDAGNGINSVIFATRRGRIGVTDDKIKALCLISLTLSLTFAVSDIAAVGIKVGLGGLTSYLAEVQGFTLCPYAIKIYEFMLIKMLHMLLAGCEAGLSAFVLSAFFKRSYLSLSANALLLGAAYALYASAGSGKVNIYSVLNIFTFANAGVGYKKYAAVNIFGHTATALWISLAVHFVLLLSLIPLAFLLHGRLRHSDSQRKGSKKPRTKSYAFLEFKKSLVQTRVLLACLLIAACAIVLDIATFDTGRSFFEINYRKYSLELQGDASPEKEEYIASVKLEFDRAKAEFALVSQLYSAGEATLSDFMKAESAKQHADKLKEVFSEAEKRYYACAEREVPLVYEVGWVKIFAGGSVFFALIIIALMAAVSSNESRGAMRQMMFATPEGRVRPYVKKLLFATVLSCFCIGMMDAVHIIMVSLHYPLPLSSAPLASVFHGAVCGKISIISALILAYVVKYVGVMLLAWAVVHKYAYCGPIKRQKNPRV